MMGLGARIAAIRERRGWSQQRLADSLGVTNATVSRYEAGHRRINTPTLARIAEALEVPLEDLTPGDEGRTGGHGGRGMKGVVLAGGLGTRLYPLTRITNKHLLPVYNKPMIFYPIETLVNADIRDVMVVTGGNNAGDFLRLLGNGRDFGLTRIHYAYQEREGGIAEALGLAEEFVGSDRCVLILGDNIIEDDISSYVANFAQQPSGARVLLKEMSERAHLVHLGVPVFDHGRVIRIEEKPAEPRSPYAVTGVYMYDAEVFEIVRKLEPSLRGELEITDVNNEYIARRQMEYDVLQGFWGDAGESIDQYMAVGQYVASAWPARTPVAVPL
jgi:glucose-1-phosphate thymidylyltransferase